jgi:hypothetical protein
MKFPMTLVVATLALGALPASNCLASSFREDPAQTLARADVNHDGFVTRAEFIGARNIQFSQMDRAKRGYVSVNAVPGFLASSARGAAAAELLHSADRNRDGKVTLAEFSTAPTPTFDRADIDHNGRLDQSEQDYFVRLVERDR